VSYLPRWFQKVHTQTVRKTPIHTEITRANNKYVEEEENRIRRRQRSARVK